MAGKNKFSSLQKIRGWTCEDVQRALTKNDLNECCPAIAKRNIDGEALLNLTEGKLALWKQDLKHAEMQKLSTFIVNVNFYPEKYSASADVLGLTGNTPAKSWNLNAKQSTPSFSKPTPSSNKPAPGLRNTGSSNGFGKQNASASNKFNKPTPPTNFNKPTPPTNVSKPTPPTNVSKPSPPTNFSKPSPPTNLSRPNSSANLSTPNSPANFSKPNPPPNFNKPNPSANFSKPNPPPNFNKPNPSANFSKPNPPTNIGKPSSTTHLNRPALPSNSNKPNSPNSFNKPTPPNNVARPVPNASRLFSPQQNQQVDKGPTNEYLPMGRKSPVPLATSALAPTNKFAKPIPTKNTISEPPKQTFYPPPATPTETYPLSDYDEDDQPEYLNIDQPENNKNSASASAYPSADRDDGHQSDTGSWGTDFDDTEQDDFDSPSPPTVPPANQSSLFNSNVVPVLPNRPPNREPALPTRPVFQPPSAFGYPQPPTLFDNSLLNGLIGQDTTEYAGDEEYSMIDEFDHSSPPALAPREYLSKPAPAPLAVPDTMAPRVPHREPVVILPSRKLSSPFAGGRLPDGYSTPKLPPREPYLNRFPRFPEPQASSPAPEPEDDCEYEVIEHREGEDDYLAPTGMQHAVSAESVSSASALAEMLRETLHARKMSLNTAPRPETPPPPMMLDHRDKTPALESKPLPKPPAVDRQFSSNQPQRPLPPPPEPGRRPSTGSSPSLKTKQWYHDVDRKRGEEMLRNGENGSFLLRPSARTENPLTLTLWHDGRIYNIGVRLRPDQRYALGSEKAMERSFGTVDEMVAFYQRDLLMLYSGGEKTGSTYLTETPGRRYMSH